ncbi:Leucine-rich repeat-containing protein 9 [Aphelenchoides fujianensis]|nr:Leucine-rich repeat-containing protein 9 [Aphelenchoides fujianensis]
MSATTPTPPSASNLKSKYYQFLEALCTANGIEIQSLKNGAIEVDELEMFFGGLPALIGLRYFDKLRVLRLVSQEVTNLQPLAEVAGSLEELWICEGILKDLSGLEACTQLRRLYLYDCQIVDGSPLAALTSLDVLWIQNNQLRSMESLLHVCGCEVVRYLDLCSGRYALSRLLRDDRQTAWLAFHFPFLEHLNGDAVQEKFLTCNTTIAETAWFDEFNRSAKAERELWISLATIERNFAKITEKLTSFLNALSKSANSVTKREGRRELAVKLQEQNQLRLKTLKKVKIALVEYERAMFTMASYILPSWRLESAYQSPLRELNRNELQTLEDVLQSHCEKNDEPRIRVRYALTFVLSSGELGRAEMEAWSHAECPSGGLWKLRALVEMCDRRLTVDYCRSLRLFKDILPLCNNAQNAELFVLAPLLRKTTVKRTLGGDEPQAKQNDEVANVNVFESQGNEKTTPWEQLELAAVCFLELQRTAQIQFEELVSWATFDDRFSDQLKKLKEVGIDLKLEKAAVPLPEQESVDAEGAEEGGEAAAESTTSKPQKSKDGKAVDYFDADLATCRWRTKVPCWSGKQLSLRNALELTIAYTRGATSFDKAEFYARSFHPFNSINLLLTRLHVAKNKLRSLKGIEQSKLLQIVIASDNQIKEKTEVEIFANFPKLCLVDLSGNPAAEIEGHRKRVLCIAQNLLYIDFDKIPVEERHHVFRKSGKVLTFELIEKLVPELEAATALNLSDNQFQMIALDRTATSKLQHITEVDLSNNELEFCYEIVELHSLKRLNLARNQLVALCSSDFGGGGSAEAEILPELEELDLSFNNLNCQSLSRIGLEKLSNLRWLNLRGNVMQRFDGAQFDFPNLQHVDASQNEIRSIRKKTMSHLLALNLADNRLKELDGLEAPRLRELNVANNRIGSCAALKNVKSMKELKTFNCTGNPVTERRVYHDFIRSSLKSLEELDAQTVQRAAAATAGGQEALQSVQKNPAGDLAPAMTAVLPPIVKLANQQSSDVKRFHALLQKSKTTSTYSRSLRSEQSEDELVVDLLTAPRAHSPATNERRRSLANAQLRRTKSAVNSFFLPNRVVVSSNFVIAGTRAVKHFRQS